MDLNLFNRTPELSQLPELVCWLVALLALLLVTRWLIKILPRNGKVKLEILGREVVEVETESLYQDKSTKEHILNDTQSDAKPEDIINQENLNPNQELNILKTDNHIK